MRLEHTKAISNLVLKTALTLLIAALSPILGQAAANNDLTEQQLAKIIGEIESIFAEQKWVGVQAAVFSNDRIMSSTNLGHADLEHNVPVLASTRFEMASINKVFTALGLLMLEEAGAVDLDMPVQDYVSRFPEKPEGVITSRLLAGFHGGIRHYVDGERTPEYYATHYDDVEDALSIFENDPLIAVPGEEFAYSSYGYNLLAAVIQNASGLKFQDYIMQTILEPLRLENTGFIDVRLPMENRSRQYSYIDPYTRETLDHLRLVPVLEHSYNMGGGNMYSTAENLATFGSQFLVPGFVSENIFQQMYEPHYASDGAPSAVSDGWLLQGLGAEDRFLMAGGSYPGVISMLLVYPDRKLVVAAITNTWGKDSNIPLLGQLPASIGKIISSQ